MLRKSVLYKWEDRHVLQVVLILDNLSPPWDPSEDSQAKWVSWITAHVFVLFVRFSSTPFCFILMFVLIFCPVHISMLWSLNSTSKILLVSVWEDGPFMGPEWEACLLHIQGTNNHCMPQLDPTVLNSSYPLNLDN